ncbi:non-ribosomal peptide synthetase [Streptomyces sp. NPDC026589]|uniref:non-ribosomal peptide synthetase n=1 Tax=Streptomyces sp. NPDC026589 TaxID=3155609 RepID=UPI003405815A
MRRHGERPAVRHDQESLTYRELDRASNAVAGLLRGAGVARGDRVAFHLDRGVKVFAALLGILKTGAAYVPVDTRYPDARRDLMIVRSRPKLVLAERGGAERMPGLDVGILEYDPPSLPGPAGDESVVVDPGVVEPDQPAALLFTSGSSGTPKAVVLEHRNLCHFARNETLPGLRPDDRVGHVSSLSFDAFHYETWSAFASGAEIVVLPSMPDLVNRDVQRELRRHRISVMLVPTMALNHVVREDREAFSSLRVLCTGGDVVLPQTSRDLLAGSFSGRLFNLYGPTEATTACVAHEVLSVAPDADSIPIGRPLAEVLVYVLDESRAQVPRGAPGELYVAGPGVARGYFDQPELTEERFPPDLFAGDGTRMYATGDLVYQDKEGDFHYLGRTDDQVKIRGYRVEPREVERMLARQSDVREAAVLVAGEGGDRYLVALVVSDSAISLRDLRKHAEALLPEFMVPSSLIRVSEIPATIHGKRDLEQLGRLAEEHRRRSVGHVPPRDAEEHYLAGVWRDLLVVERIGATDDFFELGGNSLLSFRLLRRVAKDLGVTLSSRDVLTTSRLEALASLVRDRKEPVQA